MLGAKVKRPETRVGESIKPPNVAFALAMVVLLSAKRS